MSVKIYANSNDINILHFPELNKYKFKVSTKRDAFFDTQLFISDSDETTRLRQKLEIAVGVMEKQENWMSLKIVKANLREALAQIRELEK